MTGPTNAIPRAVMKLDAERLRTLPLAPVDGFILSRIDGVLSIEDLASVTGLPTPQVLATVQKLEALRLVTLAPAAASSPPPRATFTPRSGPPPKYTPIPRDEPPPSTPPPPPRADVPPPHAMRIAPKPKGGADRPLGAPAATKTQPAPPPTPFPSPPSAPPSSPSGSSAASPSSPSTAPSPPPRSSAAPPPRANVAPSPSPPRAAHAPTDPAPFAPEPDVDLDPELQRRLTTMYARLGELDHYALLGVPRSADKKEIKRAYFELAGKLHPDRFFRKNLGSYKLKMEAIFGKVTEAHETLTSKQRRAEYDAYLASVERTRGLEAMIEDAAAQARRAEEEALRAIPISSVPPVGASQPPPPTAAAVLPPPPSTPPGAIGAPSVPPIAPSPSSIPAQPIAAPSPGAPRSQPVPSGAAPHTPNLGAIIADALSATAPSNAPPPRPSAPAPPRISVPAPPRGSEPPDARMRREVLARRLMGGAAPRVPAAPKVPAVAYASPTDAVDALKRRYDDRMEAARTAQATKYRDIGDAARAKSDMVAAANAYRVAMSFDPDEPTLKKSFEEASRAADELLSDAYTKQAQYEERAEHWADAAKSWSRVARARPNDAKAHERAAYCLVKADGNLHDAGALAQRAVALEPKDPHARVTLANVYLAAGLTLNARRELESATHLVAPDSDLAVVITQLLKRVGR